MWKNFQVFDEGQEKSPHVTPDHIELSGGSWNGNLTIDSNARHIVLQASVDTYGVVGQSMQIDVARLHRRAIEKANTSALVLEFAKLYESGELSDLDVVVGSRTFKVHKCILAARSPVLKSLLTSGMKETASDRLIIQDATPEAFAIFLQFLYTTNGPAADVDTETLLEVYILADR